MLASWPKPTQLESLLSDDRVTLSDYPSEPDYESASTLLSCRLQTLKAIAKVESSSEGAFLEVPGRPPVILFEPHIFHRLTEGKYDYAVIPDTEDVKGNHPRWSYLSYPSWKPGWYGPVSIQHRRLDSAVKLDRDAALMAASWGLFQILGENFRRCGCSSIQEFVNRMYKSAGEQLNLLAEFLLSSPSLIQSVRERDAVRFARLYNGTAYAKNSYDKKLIKAGF